MKKLHNLLTYIININQIFISEHLFFQIIDSIRFSEYVVIISDSILTWDVRISSSLCKSEDAP